MQEYLWILFSWVFDHLLNSRHQGTLTICLGEFLKLKKRFLLFAPLQVNMNESKCTADAQSNGDILIRPHSPEAPQKGEHVPKNRLSSSPLVTFGPLSSELSCGSDPRLWPWVPA